MDTSSVPAPAALRRTAPLGRSLTVAIAFVWLANGLWCKVLGRVPRHAAIVARVVGADAAPVLTVLIGCAEVVMAAWVLSGRRRRLCAATQVVVVLSMNVIEQLIAADLLLWGRFNLLWAALFCVVVALVAVIGNRDHRRSAERPEPP